MKKLLLVSFLLLFTAACAKNGGTTTGNPLTEDSSASGAAAQALGGALSASDANGLQAFYSKQSSPVHVAHGSKWEIFSLFPKAYAAGICPTFNTAAGPKCAVSGGNMWLNYSHCSFPSSSAIWDGVQAITMSAGTASCGTFPNPGASSSLYRQFVSAMNSTSPWAMVIRSGYGSVGVVDHVTSNLSNFDNQSIATLINGGYGMRVDFNGTGARSAITLRQRIAVVGSYDHTIDGSLTIAETFGGSSRTVNGTITVYLNGLQVVGTSVFNTVVHNNICCLPVSGSITTSFAAGANVAPTALGTLFVGASETLTFTGCGTAQLQQYDGTVKSVSLSRCF